MPLRPICFDEVVRLEERRHVAEKIVGHVALSDRAVVETVQASQNLAVPTGAR